MAARHISYRILHIEDDDDDALLVAYALRHELGEASQIIRARTIADGANLLAEQSFDGILLDLGLPDSTNLENDFKRLKTDRAIPIIVLTGDQRPELLTRAFACGGEDVLTKSNENFKTLASALERAFERADAMLLKRSQVNEMESFFKSFMAISRDGFLMLAEAGDILTKNSAAERMWEASNIEECLETIRKAIHASKHVSLLLKFEDGIEVHDVLLTQVPQNGNALFVATIRNMTPKRGSIEVPVRPGRDFDSLAATN
jgi:CheY-like chemotaxis protein